MTSEILDFVLKPDTTNKKLKPTIILVNLLFVSNNIQTAIKFSHDLIYVFIIVLIII